MSERIRKVVAEAVAKKVVIATLQKEFDAIHDELAKASNEAYDELLLSKGTTPKFLEDLPSGFLSEQPHLNVHIGGEYRALRFDGHIHNGFFRDGKHDKVTRRIRHADDRGSSPHLKGKKAMAAREALNKADDFKAKAKAHYEKTLATILSFTMSGALLKAWPEIQPYWPASAEKVPAYALVNFESLNKELGLPTGEEA